MITITNLNHRVDIFTWIRNEGLALLEREDFIDWDIVSEDDIEGMIVDFFAGADAGEHIDAAIFDEADGSEMAEALMKFAFGGRLQDIAEAQKALHNAMYDALKTYVQKIAEEKQGVW